MATFYVQTTGNASNSGSTDTDAPTVSGAAATVAGSVVTLDGSPDLSATVTATGPTQSTIFLADATNANMKIFKITAFDDTANTVTVSVAPTGITSSAWRIGGRVVWTPANIEATFAAGDNLIYNDSPAASASTLLTCRASGSGAAGFITVKGKTGTLPVLNHTSTGLVITANSQTGWRISNLEIDQDGASGNAIAPLQQWQIDHCKFSDCGGVAILVSASGVTILNNEFTGGVAGAIQNGSFNSIISGNYIHDCTVDGILVSGAAMVIIIDNNIIDSCAARGIFFSSSSVTTNFLAMVTGNTVYGCGNSGMEVTDADANILFENNIFSENGNAANEYNVEWVAGTADNIGWHGYNCFFHSGGGGGANLLNLTANATEVTTDPQFTDAVNGNFALGSSSPAKGTGYAGTFLGGSVGFRDMGAVQRQEAGGGGSTAAKIYGG